MRTIVPPIPSYLLTLIESLRSRLREADFQARQRVQEASRRGGCGTVAVSGLTLILVRAVDDDFCDLHAPLRARRGCPHGPRRDDQDRSQAGELIFEHGQQRIHVLADRFSSP